MRSIKTLALAAVFAAGTSAFGLAEGEVQDFVYSYGPISGTYSATTPATTDVPQAVTTAAPLQVPASPWIADRFNPNRDMTVEERWFLRAEAANQ